jgi:hypothetical protein
MRTALVGWYTKDTEVTRVSALRTALQADRVAVLVGDGVSIPRSDGTVITRIDLWE